MDSFVKPQSKGCKNITPALKRAIWDMHVGPGVKQIKCLLCGINEIYQTQNSGFDGAHIVARKYFADDLSVFYVIPSCKVCNNECDNMCVLDFLWVRNRIAALRRIIMTLYDAFVAQHEHELQHKDRMAWRVLEHLYGPTRFPLGGGIQNTKAIYEIARAEQMTSILAQSAALAQKQQALAIQLRELTESEIKPMRFGF
jgi:hypothetical protein